MKRRDSLYNRKFNLRAQAILEYGVVICVVISALIAMQVYFKRSVQGKIRRSTDEISGGTAYSRGATIGDSVITKKITEISNNKTEGTGSTWNFFNHQRSLSYQSVDSEQKVDFNEKTLPFESELARP